MHAQLNPALTRISHYLFHHEERDNAAVMLPKLEPWVEKLLAGAKVVEGRAPEGDDYLPFRTFSGRLTVAATSFGDSVRERDLKETRQWFSHLSEACTACHEVYRW